MPLLGRLLAVAAVALPLASAACATDVSDDEADIESVDGEEAALTNASVSLKYEGTCDFLRECSRWSRGFPEGYVLWGCSAENTVDGKRGPCDDDGLWVAGPTRGMCGQIAHICRGDTCVDAKVKDVSVSRSWEASNGVLDALGLNHVLTGKCSGAGGGKVKITTRRGS
jgi:hypothetical protein